MAKTETLLVLALVPSKQERATKAKSSFIPVALSCYMVGVPTQDIYGGIA